VSVAVDPSRIPDEPFGQAGVRIHLRRLWLWACLTLALVCLAMHVRSGNMVDQLARNGARSELVVRSIIDRLVIDYVPTSPREAQHVGWTADSYPYNRARARDGWQPGWKKLIGIEWGWVDLPGNGVQRTMPMWRLRIRWTTMAILYSLLGVLIWTLGRRPRADDNAAA
jgi:hypothetical protein